MEKPFQYEVEIISPVNIGDGNRYREFEYIIEGDSIGFIDVIKLLKSNKDNTSFIDYFYRSIDSFRFSWQDALKYAPKIDISEFISYQVKPCGASRVKGDIVSFIKTTGYPYIPGSSLKGSFRTGLMRGVWPSIEEEYKAKLDDTLREKDKKLKEIDDYPEEETFGKPHYSPFKFVRFSDSSLLPLDALGIYEMKILNICHGKAKWFKKNENVEESENATAIYIEALKPGIRAEGFFEIKQRTKNEEIYRIIKNVWILKNAFNAIRNDTKRYIEGEKYFYKEYGLDQVANFYQRLEELNGKLGENEILLQIGFGTGYLSKTIGCFLSAEDLKKLSKQGVRISDANLFPKTRRIIFANGNPDTVPGWVKITFREV